MKTPFHDFQRAYLNLGLRNKFILPIIVVIFMSFLCVGIFFIQDQRAKEETRLNEKAERITRLLLSSNLESIWDVDMSTLERNCQVFFEDDEIIRLVVIDTFYGNERLINLSKDIKGTHDITKTADFIKGDQKVASLSMVFTNYYIDRNLAQMKTTLVILSVVVFILMIGIIWVVSMIALRPLKGMMAGVQHLTEGNLNFRIPVQSQDELGKLANSFNTMAIELNQYHGHLREIVEKRTAELKRANDHLHQEISERKHAEILLLQAKDAAEESNRVKSEFLANMSHELRTPLNAIIGFSQIMFHDQALKSGQKDNLQIINRSGKHLLALINDILDMSKIEAGRIALDERDFDLYQLLDEVHDIFKIKAGNKGIEIVFEHEPEVPRFVRTDETKLRQILVNLTGNAVKFTQDGSVKVQVNIIGESELQFSISDTGPGIPPDDIDRLFDPFAQTQTGKDSHEGTGLGLSISEKFVNLMGGKISIDSRLERGSIFKFDIKAHKGEKSRIAEELPTRRVIGLEESDSGGNNKHYRILIVDDIHSNRKILATLLAPLGLDIREAKSGREALDVWKEWQPHLIWLDIRMPEIDGYAVIKRIKNTAPEHPPVIISISASTFEEDRQKALDLGCDGFVGKPFKEFEIFEEMKKHLHLRYVYAEDIQKDDLAREVQEQALSLETVKGLPSKWKFEMKQAIEHVDPDQMGILIEEMRKQDKTFAEEIQQRIDQFDYEKVLECL